MRHGVIESLADDQMDEIARQIRIVSAGGRIVRETRLWDADLGASATMRTKEEADEAEESGQDEPPS